MTERLAALKDGEYLAFWGLKQPMCPHCAHEYDISAHEAWKLYEEGEHEIECPNCDMDYRVCVRVNYTYSTDEQEYM